MLIRDAATNAAVAAATTQQDQCEALIAAWAGGNVKHRMYGAGSQHLRTQTLGPFTIDTNADPMEVRAGSVLADTAIAPNTPGDSGIESVLDEFRTDDETVIFDTEGITHGDIKTLCKPTPAGVAFTADPNLPVFSVPYAVPDAGEAVAIGGNDAMDLTPTEDSWSEYAWNYSLFGSYGGGAFVPGYSAHGAYALVGTGGHGHADNPGAAVFDFTTALWSRRDNANGVARLTSDPHRFAEAATTGAPHYEITGSEVPAPPHPYANLVALPGGTRGRVAYITRSAIVQEARNSASSHEFDLDTRLWNRMETSGSVASEPECDAVYDPDRNAVWLPTATPHNFTTVKYLDLNDLTIKSTAAMAGFPSSDLAGYYRCWMHEGLLMRNCGASGLWYLDPDDAVPEWAECAVSGTLPHVTNRPARYSDGKYYSFRGSSASYIVDRLAPPVDPKAGTWVADTVTLTGDQLPAKSETTEHYTRLFYVPAIDCLAWIAGGTNPVLIFKP